MRMGERCGKPVAGVSRGESHLTETQAVSAWAEHQESP